MTQTTLFVACNGDSYEAVRVDGNAWTIRITNNTYKSTNLRGRFIYLADAYDYITEQLEITAAANRRHI